MTVKEYLSEAVKALDFFTEYKARSEAFGDFVPSYLNDLPRVKKSLDICFLSESLDSKDLLLAIEVFCALMGFYGDLIDSGNLSDKASFEAVDALHLLSAMYEGACRLYESH